MRKVIIAPSVLSANYLQLSQELQQITTAGADWIHFDVMDFDFVPNLTFGPKILSDITKECSLFIDCHMMVRIKNWTIEEYIIPFIKAGANLFTFHFEALNNNDWKILATLKTKYNFKLGMSLKPKTNVDVLAPYFPILDLILIMSVEPGFGGQSFINDALYKIKRVRTMLDNANLSHQILIEVDGGINAETGAQCVASGADVLVAGSYLFGHPDIKTRLEKLKR